MHRGRAFGCGMGANMSASVHTGAASGASATARVSDDDYLALGGGVPIVLLHSSLGSKSQWATLAAQMATRFRVLAFDLLGYGNNPLPDAREPFTLDHETRDVAARLDGLVGPRCRVHFVGHSYGALVALRFAQRYPSRVASLTMFEPVAFTVLDGADSARADMAQLADVITHLVASGCHHLAAQWFVDFWSGDGTYARLSPSVRASMARRMAKVPLDFRAALRQGPTAPGCRAIAVPTLLLAGRRSPEIARRIVDALTRELPDCSTRWIDGGHMTPVTHPQAVNGWVDAFIAARTCDDIAPNGHPMAPSRAWSIRAA
jgi:pimeloyl-ACP methyl ester carboxylesterase